MGYYYTVRQGDYLSKIAHAHGFADWRVIYDHPENKVFRAHRPEPNLLHPGDRLFIPDLGEKRVECHRWPSERGDTRGDPGFQGGA